MGVIILNYYRNLHIAAAALAVFMLLCGCTQIDESVPVDATAVTEEEEKNYPVTIGSLVFNSTPENAASLSPAVTEIAAELGFSDKLIGRSSYCTYPESITSLDTLGSAAYPDVDAIIEKAPQLLISQSPIAKKDITAIEASGTRVLIIPAPSSVSGLYELYSDIYRVFNGASAEEESVLNSIFEPLEKEFEADKDLLGSYVYILSPDLAIASDSTFAGDFFSHMGTNAAADRTDNTITAEELAELDPDCLILPPSMDTDDLPEELSDLSAVKSGKVIILDDTSAELLERPTSRIYLAAQYVSECAAHFGRENTAENEAVSEETDNSEE